jgi:hypothetical protein
MEGRDLPEKCEPFASRHSGQDDPPSGPDPCHQGREKGEEDGRFQVGCGPVVRTHPGEGGRGGPRRPYPNPTLEPVQIHVVPGVGCGPGGSFHSLHLSGTQVSCGNGQNARSGPHVQDG